MPVAATIALELRRARLCLDCDTAYSPQPAWYGPQPACPRCASTTFFPLSVWMDLKPQENGQ